MFWLLCNSVCFQLRCAPLHLWKCQTGSLLALQPQTQQMRAFTHHAGVAVEDGRVKGAAVVRFQGDRERHMTVWEASCPSCPASLAVPEAYMFCWVLELGKPETAALSPEPQAHTVT